MGSLFNQGASQETETPAGNGLGSIAVDLNLAQDGEELKIYYNAETGSAVLRGEQSLYNELSGPRGPLTHIDTQTYVGQASADAPEEPPASVEASTGGYEVYVWQGGAKYRTGGGTWFNLAGAFGQNVARVWTWGGL